MDYIGSKCPVCHKYFHADDDIVVCPECGAPHHRDCYEAIDHCYYEDRHAEGFDYTESSENADSNVVICRSCGKENDKNAFFCKYCAAPLSKEDDHRADQTGSDHQQSGASGIPFGSATPIYMDPLGGIPGDTDMGDGVTAGEIAKYVKQNTPYFVRVFNNIRQVNRSRFNFCAALFAGGYLLYRKMYKIGALLTGLQLAMMILSTYISIRYQDEYLTIASNSRSLGSISQLLNYFSDLEKGHLFVLYLPLIISGVMLVMRIVIGATANRLYFKHCKQQVVRIKSEVQDNENPDNVLQTRGGVNMPLAISLLVTNLLITYLPNVISGLM